MIRNSRGPIPELIEEYLDLLGDGEFVVVGDLMKMLEKEHKGLKGLSITRLYSKYFEQAGAAVHSKKSSPVVILHKRQVSVASRNPKVIEYLKTYRGVAEYAHVGLDELRQRMEYARKDELSEVREVKTFADLVRKVNEG